MEGVFLMGQSRHKAFGSAVRQWVLQMLCGLQNELFRL
jgi:hypothetical protein